MFFAHMSLWAIALFLMVLLVAKHFAIPVILKTNLAVQDTQGQGWVGALITNSALNALIDFAILFLFAGFLWAAAFALADAVIHYLIGYWKKRSRLPTLSSTLLTVYDAASFLHTSSYIGVVALVVKYLLPHSAAAGLIAGTSSLTSLF